ncbi:hypothetical protein [Paenibacillus polymyxa]|uniref:hypothetical protein n=1 Tax=Paenibacillus polymyxa TaxID=1406 RepID=UPI000A775457|nr:hypothetical protein [Paenibacillus polymyxa]
MQRIVALREQFVQTVFHHEVVEILKTIAPSFFLTEHNRDLLWLRHSALSQVQ